MKRFPLPGSGKRSGMAPRPKKPAESAQAARLSRRFDWQTAAACRGLDPEVFFAATDEPTRAALAVCSRCPVRVECLGYAIAAGERFGIWGGTTEKQRASIPSEERARIVAAAAGRAA